MHPDTVQYIIKFSIYRNVFHRIQKIGEEYDTNADRTDNIIIRHSKELSNSVKLIFFPDMCVKNSPDRPSDAALKQSSQICGGTLEYL